MKNVHALLVGLAGAALTAIGGSIAGVDPASFTHDPTALALIAAAIGAASRGIGALLNKLG